MIIHFLTFFKHQLVKLNRDTILYKDNKSGISSGINIINGRCIKVHYKWLIRMRSALTSSGATIHEIFFTKRDFLQ